MAIFSPTITLKALEGISLEGLLLADDSVILLSEGPVISRGIIETMTLIEEGSTFQVGGKLDVGFAFLTNADGAAYLNTGDYSGVISDPGDIIINASQIITLIGDATFSADSDGDGIPGQAFVQKAQHFNSYPSPAQSV